MPTFEESGIEGVRGTMVGLHAPAGTPAEIIQRIHAALTQAASSPAFSQRMETLNFVLVLSTPEELRQREAADAQWATDVARMAKILPQ